MLIGIIWYATFMTPIHDFVKNVYRVYLISSLEKKIKKNTFFWFLPNKKDNSPYFCERSDLITFDNLKGKPIDITTYSAPFKDTVYAKYQNNGKLIYQNTDGIIYKGNNIQTISTNVLKDGLDMNKVKRLVKMNHIPIKVLKRQLKLFTKPTFCSKKQYVGT